VFAEKGVSGVFPRASSALPHDSVIVVRTTALTDLINRLTKASAGQHASDPLAESLGARERTTLLTIIAAVCQEARIDVSRPSKAGAKIAELTQQMGAPVSTRAIEDHLKRIKDALERRDKT
jgi:hypothetical protein